MKAVLFSVLLLTSDPTAGLQEAVDKANADQHKPKVRISRVKPRPKPVSGHTGGNGDIWEALARCESGLRNDTGDPYWGYFQWSLATWRGMGLSGVPSDYDYDYQLAASKRLQAKYGWSQWPACSRKLGLR